MISNTTLLDTRPARRAAPRSVHACKMVCCWFGVCAACCGMAAVITEWAPL